MSTRILEFKSKMTFVDQIVPCRECAKCRKNVNINFMCYNFGMVAVLYKHCSNCRGYDNCNNAHLVFDLRNQKEQSNFQDFLQGNKMFCTDCKKFIEVYDMSKITYTDHKNKKANCKGVCYKCTHSQ